MLRSVDGDAGRCGEGSGQEGTSGVDHSCVVVGFRLGGHGRCQATCAWWLEDFDQADIEEHGD
jgi:hypothetical protein